MRLVCNVFHDSSRIIRETTDDGDLIGYVEGAPTGPRKVKRVVAYVELGADNSPEAIGLLVKGLDDLKAEMERRVATRREVPARAAR